MSTTEQVTDRSTEVDEVHTLSDCALTDEDLDAVTGGAYQVVRAIAIRADGKNMQLWVTSTT